MEISTTLHKSKIGTSKDIPIYTWRGRPEFHYSSRQSRDCVFKPYRFGTPFGSFFAVLKKLTKGLAEAPRIRFFTPRFE